MASNLTTISRGDLARINNAVKKIERLPTSLPTLQGAAERFIDSVPIYNSDSAAIPQYGVAWLDTLHTDDVSYVAAKPPFSSIRKYAIALTPVPPQTQGRAWIYGSHPVRITLINGQTLTEGDAVAPRRNDWTAQKFALGPMCVERIISQDGLVVTADVLIGPWRGDEIYVRDNNDTVYGPFRARRWSPAFALSQPSPGKTLIEAAS